jgi:hypothetical protein
VVAMMLRGGKVSPKVLQEISLTVCGHDAA